MDIKTNPKTGEMAVKLLKVEQRRLTEAAQTLETIARCTGNTKKQEAADEIRELLKEPEPDQHPAHSQDTTPTEAPTRAEPEPQAVAAPADDL